MKLVMLDGDTVTAGDLSFDPLRAFGELTVYNSTSPKQIVEHIGDAEIVLCNKARISREVMQACPSMRYVGLFATGYNNVDLAAAAEYGITVCNAPDYSTDAVAQFTFALILEHYSKVGEYATSVEAGGWLEAREFSYFLSPISELAGRTIGIIGFGSIGQRVARISRAFDMQVLVYTRTPRPELAGDGVRMCSFVELLAQSDIVSIHCPLTEQTRGLFGAEAIGKMKRDALLVNTARGPIVDEQALADALRDWRISGAALDVVSREPMREDNPLIGAPNCIITPHIAWAPKQTRARLMQLVADNLSAFLRGEPINVVK